MALSQDQFWVDSEDKEGGELSTRLILGKLFDLVKLLKNLNIFAIIKKLSIGAGEMGQY